jgi:hypothetical protein
VSLTVDELIRLVDGLEDRAEGYLLLDDVQQAAGGADLTWAIDDAILLVDYRSRLDGSPVTLCRLNRRHPRVARLTAW